MPESKRFIQFHSGAVPDGTLEVLAVRGAEAISQVFRFDLELVSARGDIDFDAMLEKPAALLLRHGVPVRGGGAGEQTLKLHGVLSSFEEYEKGMRWVRYRATLVPALWRLSMYMKCRIFLEKSVPQILEEVLKEAGLTGQDYEIKAAGRSYPKREYVVQYQESDLNFIQRLCEHEGIFYYFEHRGEAEKVVFGDAPEVFLPIQGGSTIPYRPVGTARDSGGEEGWFEPESINAWSCRQSVVAAEVVLKDYNYQTPSVDLKVSTPVESRAAFGAFYEYGNHYKDAGEGKTYARLRADEIACRRRIFSGRGDAKAFRAGSKFTLEDHYRGDFNGEYLITELHHDASQPIEYVPSTGVSLDYGNEFSCVPASVTFRPRRVTPRPRVSGTVYAKVDASGGGEYAEIDDQGRYKVQVPFDLSGRSGGKASRYVRMAQPYAGGGMGMHFPLHKGTEVILTHANGDPDRPLISGAVPNPETSAPVQGGNATQCKIDTGGGTKITVEDTAGSQQMKMETPSEKSFFTMGAANSPPGFNFGSAANMNRELGGNELLKAAGDQLAKIAGKIDQIAGGNHSTTVGGKKKTIVAASNTTMIGGSDKTIVGGSSKLQAGGSRSVVAGGAIKHQAGAAYSMKSSAALKSQSGAATNIKAGAALKMQSGAATSIKAGAALNAKSAAATNVKAGAALKMQSGAATNIKSGGPLNAQAPSINIKGPTNIKGATKIKGDTQIKGATKITGATQIKGATKIKGATQITGTTKINGNNLKVT